MSNAEILAQNYPNMMTITGHDNAIIGVADRCGMMTVVAYDRDIVVRNLMEEGCTTEEALEYYQFNVEGAYVGELTPILVTFLGEL